MPRAIHEEMPLYFKKVYFYEGKFIESYRLLQNWKVNGQHIKRSLRSRRRREESENKSQRVISLRI